MMIIKFLLADHLPYWVPYRNYDQRYKEEACYQIFCTMMDQNIIKSHYHLPLFPQIKELALHANYVVEVLFKLFQYNKFFLLNYRNDNNFIPYQYSGVNANDLKYIFKTLAKDLMKIASGSLTKR